MIEIKDIAKETQSTMQPIWKWTTPDGDTDVLLPEDYRHTIFDAISSLCEDICQSKDALDNLNRGKAIHNLADAYRTLSKSQSAPTVADPNPVQLMQELKAYCTAREDCALCTMPRAYCDKYLADAPADWNLED